MAEMTAIADIPAWHGNDRFSNRIFKTLQVEKYFNHRLVQSSDDTPYDLHRTAERNHIALRRSKLMGQFALLDVVDERWRVTISEDVTEGSDAERFLFGHELGHIFLFECIDGATRKGLVKSGYLGSLIRGKTYQRHRPKIEYFCDYFAYRAEAHGADGRGI